MWKPDQLPVCLGALCSEWPRGLVEVSVCSPSWCIYIECDFCVRTVPLGPEITHSEEITGCAVLLGRQREQPVRSTVGQTLQKFNAENWGEVPLVKDLLCRPGDLSLISGTHIKGAICL